MRRTLAKPLSLLLSLSLTWSLMPAPGMAYAAQGENTAPIAQEAANSNSASTNVETTTAGGNSANDQASSEQPVTRETSSNVETTSVASADQTATSEPTAVADTTTSIPDQVTTSSAVTSSATVAEATVPSNEPNEEEKKAEEEAKAKAEEEARKAAEAKAAEGEGNPSQVLSDAELDALVVELDESQLADVEEGEISLRAQAVQGWARIWGETALDTMQKILQYENVFPSKRGGTVVVATADGYWDALAACGLAGIHDAPIVLTSTWSLSPQARSEIARLRPESILVMGGTSVITDATYSELQTLCPNIARIWGQECYDTAVEIYKSGMGQWGDTNMAFICTSAGYWDALSVAPYAWNKKVPIFLTGPGYELTPSTLEALKSGGFTSVVITGGTSVVSPSVEGQLDAIGITNHTRIGGEIALDTSGLLAKWELDHGLTLKNLTVATSNGYWDALTAAPHAGKLDSVIVLVSSGGDYRALDAVYNYKNNVVEHGHIIGGTSVIPSGVERRITANWALQSMSVTPGAVRQGGKVQVSSSLILGDADASAFKYRYSWSRSDGADAGATDLITANSYEVTLNEAGDYTITLEVSGPGGTQSMSKNVACYALYGLSLDESGSNYNATANLGVSGNRASGVEFRFTWARQGSDATGEIRGWSADPTCFIDPGSLGDWSSTYTITVEARDGAGSLGTASATLRPDRMTALAQGYGSPTDKLVMVDWTNCWVGIYQGGPGHWNRVRYTRCSVGAGDNTPIGEFYIGNKGYSFGHGYTCYYWTDYWLGEWAFHSVLYREGTFDIQDGRLGEHISMGCIRMPIEEAKWLQDNVPYDTKVVIYK